ncbi:cytochrome c biogenesis CcdA family protein [Nocardioides limicola]|uniref:cytochrome c biogenesis CcdA family protein n=1 Tax=Nocardioides limicola TaxID=2803368 RepID=UPI001EF030E8|nr:cytochrome c biogenesis CcdA family protein [Nocardioides sp. DJM-14]
MPDGMALAVGAGLLAAVNPCGFALLPAYLSLFVVGDQPSRLVAVARAMRATAALTVGFSGVFLLFGLAIAPVASWVQGYLPAFTVVLGLVVAAAGAWVLAGRRLPAFTLGGRGGSGVPTRFWPMAGFGASYAIASLGCTIAPFLAVVVTAFRAGSTVDGVTLFLGYAAGMGVVVGAASLAVALARTGTLTRIRAAGAWLPRLGGAVLLVAGGYVAWYGGWELRVLYAGAGRDPVIAAGEQVQHWLAGLVSGVGAGGFVVVVLVLAVGGVALGWRRQRAQRSRNLR